MRPFVRNNNHQATSYVDNKYTSQQLLVDGYIRAYAVREIPTVLTELCLLMVTDLAEKWSNVCSSKELTYCCPALSNNHICKVNAAQKDRNKWRNAFGSLTVKAGELQIWRVRLVNTADRDQFGAGKLKRSAMIGIVSRSRCINTTQSERDSFFCDAKYKEQCHGYAFYAYDGSVFSTHCARKMYGCHWEREDVITITLDLTTRMFGSLSFKVNDECQGIAFDQIDLQQEYCLALSLFFAEEVEIMNQMLSI